MLAVVSKGRHSDRWFVGTIETELDLLLLEVVIGNGTLPLSEQSLGIGSLLLLSLYHHWSLLRTLSSLGRSLELDQSHRYCWKLSSELDNCSF